MVAEDAEHQANKIPQADQKSIVAPAAGFRDKLSPQNGRAKGKNGEDDSTNILAAILDWNDFTGTSKCNELIEAGTNTRKDLAS